MLDARETQDHRLSEIQWKKVPVREAVDCINQVIPVGTNVLREKVIFVDQKMVENKTEEVLFFMARLVSGKEDGLELSWVKNILDTKRVGPGCLKGEINLGIQENENGGKSVIVVTESKRGEQKAEVVQRFSPLKR